MNGGISNFISLVGICLLACGLPLLLGAAPVASPNRPLIGVIRWDGASVDFKKGQYGYYEQIALGPDKWHGKLPFWATVSAPNTCRLDGENQEVMDREIAYAKEVGIDYWAFCWYPDHKVRRLYQQSPHAADVKCCAILVPGNDFRDKDFNELVDAMKAANYQKVLGGRPLLYVGGDTKKEVIDRLRQGCAGAHLAAPFVVVMGWNGPEAAARCSGVGADAIGNYSSWAPGTSALREVPYSRLAAFQRSQWQQWLKTGKQMVPWVNVGVDPRPRIESNPPYPGASIYGRANYSMATGPQFAAQLRLAIAFVRRCPASCRADTILCYSWNEFSEGGTICPKLSGDRQYLDAIKDVTHGLQSSHP